MVFFEIVFTDVVEVYGVGRARLLDKLFVVPNRQIAGEWAASRCPGVNQIATATRLLNDYLLDEGIN